MIYLDASVIIAFYLDETYSDRAQALYRSEVDLVLSEYAELEVWSVLSRLVRVGSLDFSAARETGDLFDEHLDTGLYARLHLRPDHYHWARDAIARFDLPLKAPDALHLAAARRDGLRLVTADRQLARNAEILDVAFDLIEP